MTTPTTNFGWEKPDIGGSPDTWGDELNAVIDAIDSEMAERMDSDANLSDLSSVVAALGNLGFIGVAGATGRIKIPVSEGGTLRTIMIQWGSTGVIGVDAALGVTFGTAFDTECWGVVLCSSTNNGVAAGASLGNYSWRATVNDVNGFIVTNDGAASNFFYIAIGR